MNIFIVIGMLVTGAVLGYGIYFVICVALELWRYRGPSLHRGTPWVIGSARTDRHFGARFWGLSWVVRRSGPTRGIFYMKSDRERA